jgi:homospermidine synthase
VRRRGGVAARTCRQELEDAAASAPDDGCKAQARGAYWYGSRLSIEEARALAPYNNATSLQVTAAVLGGIIWAMENPRRGVVEPDEIDHARIMEIARPYLGTVIGVYSDWTPLQDRGLLFPEAFDTGDPWQFGNFRVT